MKGEPKMKNHKAEALRKIAESSLDCEREWNFEEFFANTRNSGCISSAGRREGIGGGAVDIKAAREDYGKFIVCRNRAMEKFNEYLKEIPTRWSKGAPRNGEDAECRARIIADTVPCFGSERLYEKALFEARRVAYGATGIDPGMQKGIFLERRAISDFVREEEPSSPGRDAWGRRPAGDGTKEIMISAASAAMEEMKKLHQETGEWFSALIFADGGYKIASPSAVADGLKYFFTSDLRPGVKCLEIRLAQGLKSALDEIENLIEH
jgi:hypothetical protein